MDVGEVLRLLKSGRGDRAIACSLGIDRKTVSKYRCWAQSLSLLAGELPKAEELHRLLEEDFPAKAGPQSISTVEPYREVVIALRERGVEIAAIRQRLKEEYGYQGSYASV